MAARVIFEQDDPIFDALKYVGHFVNHGFVPVGYSYVWHVGACHIVSSDPLHDVVGTQPMLLHLKCRQRKQWGIYFGDLKHQVLILK